MRPEVYEIAQKRVCSEWTDGKRITINENSINVLVWTVYPSLKNEQPYIEVNTKRILQLPLQQNGARYRRVYSQRAADGKLELLSTLDCRNGRLDALKLQTGYASAFLPCSGQAALGTSNRANERTEPYAATIGGLPTVDEREIHFRASRRRADRSE